MQFSQWGGGGYSKQHCKKYADAGKIYIIEAHTDALCLKYLQFLKNIIFWHIPLWMHQSGSSAHLKFKFSIGTLYLIYNKVMENMSIHIFHK